MALIFLLSSQSGLAVTEDVAVERPLRGFAHLASFALLAALLLFALRGLQRPTMASAALALAISTLYAVSDEWHQSMVPDRTGRLEDIVTDVIGALLGLLVAALVLTFAARAREPSGPADP
jgi:VanZ family protein